MPPETRYARSGDVSVAYQVVGDGPLDLVAVPGFVSHVEWAWEEPSVACYLRRLASFTRLLHFDKRGTGLSDRIAGVSTLEERMDDIRAVMDAAGSERAVIYGLSEGGPLAALFAATYPERTSALILYGTFASLVRQPDYPWKRTPEELRRLIEERARTIHETWGSLEAIGQALQRMAPSAADDEGLKRWLATLLRLGASPGAEIARQRMNAEIDVRHVLPAIRVPTLVLHRTGDRDSSVEEGRYIAAHIPGAKFVELPGDDHFPMVGDMDSVLDEIEEFVTGARPDREPDRVLATVMFTDIVSSTEHAVRLGDRRWRDLQERHHALVRRELARHRGREVDTAGDGFLATFDGPARAVRCAVAIGEGVRTLGLEVRAGLHTGECELRGDRVSGIAVHTGARVMAQAGAGEVLVSSTVKDLVAGSGLRFEDRGAHAFKGVPGEWRLYAVV
jgi:pimeloyl-ACP methyl ester carboxylesterase/class 3 adenylate cyclase